VAITRSQAVAVLRIDSHPDDPARDARLLATDPDTLIKVVSVWPNVDLATAEAARLNELNGPKGSRYIWQVTHLSMPRDSAPRGRR
jgi:hypothetical protein